jgi:hypothetical protein
VQGGANEGYGINEEEIAEDDAARIISVPEWGGSWALARVCCCGVSIWKWRDE